MNSDHGLSLVQIQTCDLKFSNLKTIWRTLMERIQSKCEELLNILPYVQCHDCKDVPGPCRKTRNRYSCVDGSHVLCENHKVKFEIF